MQSKNDLLTVIEKARYRERQVESELSRLKQNTAVNRNQIYQVKVCLRRYGEKFVS